MTSPEEAPGPSHHRAPGARCENCGHSLDALQLAQEMRYNLGAAVMQAWRAHRSPDDDPVAVLDTAITHLLAEIALHQEGASRAAGRELGALEAEIAQAPAARPVIRVHLGDAHADYVLVTPCGGYTVEPFTVAGELADFAAAAAFGLPQDARYTLMYAHGREMHAVHRDQGLRELAAEEGHESRHYVILTVA